MAKRPRTPAAETKETKANPFVEALRFINLVTKEQGQVHEVHSLIRNNWIVAHNGTIGAGHKVEEDIYAAPNNHLMLQALTKCGEHFSITQLDGFRLSIKSAKFKAFVPCIDPIALNNSVSLIPDQPQFDINDSFKQGLQIVGTLANDKAESVATVSILMNEGSLIATDGRIIFEYWHGLQLPYGAALPKAIVAPLVKSAKKLAKFGVSHSSVTFWFEDGSWLKTQIYAERWPDVTRILNRKCNAWPIPADFWNGVAAVAPFSSNGAVYFGAGTLASHLETGVGAAFEVPGLPKGPVFSTRLLELIKPHAKEVDFLVDGGRMLMFYGQNIRGVIAGMGRGD